MKIYTLTSFVALGMRSEGDTPKIGESTVDFFHNNAPAHRSVLVKDFLAKISVTTLEHSPYFPDLDPVDFYLFPRIKPVSK